MSEDSVNLLVDVPGLAPAPGYSYAASSSGELVFLAGQVAQDERGELVGCGDFGAQAAQVFANLRRVLAAVGCGPADVLKVNYFVVGLNRDRLLCVRALRDSVFTADRKPASTLIGVEALFDPEALIEIEAVAARHR